MRPGAKFSTTTSARSTMFKKSARPSACLRSIVTLRLLALKTRKNIASSPGTSGRLRRDCSPPGGSILMTSAPSQPRNWVHVVPASNWVRSRIRMPLSARSAMAWSPWPERVSDAGQRGPRMLFERHGGRRVVDHQGQRLDDVAGLAAGALGFEQLLPHDEIGRAHV